MHSSASSGKMVKPQSDPSQRDDNMRMAPLLVNVSNSIWHAFSALAGNNTEYVLKSKLKVLTANTGTLLDLYGVEKGLDHFRSTPELNFADFRFYLETELFSSVTTSLSLQESQQLENRIEDICWLVCRKKYLSKRASSISDTAVYHLFRVFCFLADLVPVSGSDNSYQVLMHTSEVEKLCSDIASSVGLEWEGTNSDIVISATESFKFQLFLDFIEKRLGNVIAQEALHEAIADIYQTYIHDVIKKGPLYKRGYLLPSLREYWFVLKTTELSYYKTRGETDACATILLNPHCRVETPLSSSKEKAHRILIIVNPERCVELAAVDHRSRLQWISALQLAISNSGGMESYQRRQYWRRRSLRDASVLRLREETLHRTSQNLEIQTTREKLSKEIQAREAADQKAKELQSSLDKHKLETKELMDMRNRLEKLLEEETQAKRDEEIVRNLQARVLREEWQRREELERLQKEQRRMLAEEREKRLAFERVQTHKEQQLRVAQEKLCELERERQSLDQELQAARFKINKSEKSKDILEAQLRMISPQLKQEPERVRRAMSFMGSSRDRPTLDLNKRTFRRADD